MIRRRGRRRVHTALRPLGAHTLGEPMLRRLALRWQRPPWLDHWRDAPRSQPWGAVTAP